MMFSLGCGVSAQLTDSHKEIKSILMEQGAAWNRGDLEAFMKAYEPSDALLFTSGGKIRRGYDETLSKYQARYGKPGMMGQLEFTVIDFRQLDARSAITLGAWKLTETALAS